MFEVRRRFLRWLAVPFLTATVVPGLTAQQDPPVPRAIEPPSVPLPSEAASAGVTRFSFVAYGDTRSLVDGLALQPEHGALIDLMVEAIGARASTPFPIKFVLQSGDAVTRGTETAEWDVSFTPLIEKLTRGAGVPYFFSIGNHDAALPPSTIRAVGLRNTLSAISKLIPAEGSPRRLNGTPTYAVGYGNLFAIAIDSTNAADETQLAWVANQLETLDRSRYRHIVAIFHYPMFSSGPHGGSSPGLSAADAGDSLEAPTAAMRNLYGPLFRRHHIRMTITGHDHLHEHWVERYTAGGVTHRIDHVVSGGGGAPIYTYRGEPAMAGYLAAGADEGVRLEHLVKPGVTSAANPHHFVIVRVDGDRLSQEVIATGPTPYAPYGGQSRIDLDDRASSR
jgi:hypothetical protein